MTTLRCFSFFVVLLVQSAYAAEPTCTPNPSESLKRAVIGIERMFDPDEVYVGKLQKVYGARGTAWFLNENTIVTINHVVTGAQIEGEWKKVRLFWSDKKNVEAHLSFLVRVRVKHKIPTLSDLEPIVTLELEEPFLAARFPKIRARPLQRNEAVVGLVYSGGALRFAEGRFALPESKGDEGDGKPRPQYLPFEMIDREKGVGDRYVFDHGASGAPIFDCEGEVVAVAQGFFIREMSIAGRTIRVTTPWGEANVTGVPATPLLYKIK